MDAAPVFGVLCGISGGYYYGSILTGAVRAAGAVGGRVIAVKTSDAGLPIVDMSAPQNLVWPVAFDHVAGFAVILNAVRPDYLESIRATGKPVVMISDEAPGFACPVVMADGRTGVRAAVDHLLGHGHRRIAFVGCLPVADVRQRYRAYCEALSANGIRPDPRLLFEVGHNVEHAGEEAARRMLAAGMPSTAVVAGSDLNAIGLMNGLRAAGLRLPEDQAVVGFDDMAGVGCLSPALTSVRQPFDVLGERAVELILQHLAGQPVPVGHHYVETSLAVRNSCGCRPGRQSPDAVDGQPNDGGDGPPAARLRTSQLVQRMADGFGLRGRPDPVTDAVRTRAAEAVAALVHMKAEDPVPAAMLPGVERALDQVCRLDPRPETASEVAASVRAYADACLARPDDTPVPADVDAGVARVLMALVNVQARARLEDSTRFQAYAGAQYEVSMDLLRSHEQDPRLLDWLRRTTWRGGSLGLWQQCADRIDSQLLDIASVLDQSDSGSSPSLSRGIPVSAFPPVEVLAMVEPGTADMVTVLPIRIDHRDWGMLAIVGPPECWELTGREMSNQTAALLTVALNHQALLRTLREQEALLRYSSLHDALTGLPNRVLFSDRLARAVQAAQVDLAHRYAVLFIDLDGFKQVNDTLGHPTGDRLLIHVAQRLQANLRTDDVIARFGGDEFAVLIDSHTDVGVVTAMAANLIAILERPFDIDGAQICISASIGIAHGHDGYQHADEVLRDADTAMYSAKNWGKGRYVVFAPTTREPAISM